VGLFGCLENVGRCNFGKLGDEKWPIDGLVLELGYYCFLSGIVGNKK
jgi:hypothetical protein